MTQRSNTSGASGERRAAVFAGLAVVYLMLVCMFTLRDTAEPAAAPPAATATRAGGSHERADGSRAVERPGAGTAERRASRARRAGAGLRAPAHRDATFELPAMRDLAAGAPSSWKTGYAGRFGCHQNAP
ncbi:MAG TPA: hypothetical protein VH165_34950 [Kofleriaceae bacterium]|jgi:hypothetical protein|nr:hypothetical protein [Kofleriaceae bacterium]